MDLVPKYQKPPVVELVCGILFRRFDGFLVPHYGTLWERFREEYPLIKEMPPIAPAIEKFEESAGGPPGSDELPLFLPRIWFQSQDDTGLIQVQQDRFLHNWKRAQETDEYPHYENVIRKFEEHLNRFELFLSDNEIGLIELLQQELTYVNHIPINTSSLEVPRVFPDFQWRNSKDRFLADIDGLTWRTNFRLPGRTGRLHIDIRTGIRQRDRQKVLRFDLTARGITPGNPRGEMWKWFDVAHDWIVRAFADLTDLQVQKEVWGREDG